MWLGHARGQGFALFPEHMGHALAREQCFERFAGLVVAVVDMDRGRLFAGVLVSLFQVYAFLLVAYFVGVELPPWGYVVALPALILTGMMFGALGMLLSSTIKQLENFAGIMNFVIFPMFFASSALYPLWKMREGSWILYEVCRFNPFTYAVELIRFAFYQKMNWEAFAVVGGCTVVFLALSVWAYDPSRGIQQRKAMGPAAAG